MYSHVFNAHGVSFWYICNVAVANIMTVYYYYQSTSDCLHFISFFYYHPVVFPQPNTYTIWFSPYCFENSSKSSVFLKIRIKYYTIQKLKSFFFFSPTNRNTPLRPSTPPS